MNLTGQGGVPPSTGGGGGGDPAREYLYAPIVQDATKNSNPSGVASPMELRGPSDFDTHISDQSVMDITSPTDVTLYANGLYLIHFSFDANCGSTAAVMDFSLFLTGFGQIGPRQRMTWADSTRMAVSGTHVLRVGSSARTIQLVATSIGSNTSTVTIVPNGDPTNYLAITYHPVA